MEEVVEKVTELIKSNKTVVLIVLALIGICLLYTSNSRRRLMSAAAWSG